MPDPIPAPAPVVAVAPAPAPEPAPEMFVKEEEEMQLVMRDTFVPEVPAQPIAVQASMSQEEEYLDETEEQKEGQLKEFKNCVTFLLI